MTPWLLCLSSLSKSLWSIFLWDYSPELQALGRQTSLLVCHSSSSPSPVLTQKLYCSVSKRKRDGELLRQPGKDFCCKSGVCCIYCYIHWIHCTELWINFLLCLATSWTRGRNNIIPVTLCSPMSLTQTEIDWSMSLSQFRRKQTFSQNMDLWWEWSNPEWLCLV